MMIFGMTTSVTCDDKILDDNVCNDKMMISVMTISSMTMSGIMTSGKTGLLWDHPGPFWVILTCSWHTDNITLYCPSSSVGILQSGKLLVFRMLNELPHCRALVLSPDSAHHNSAHFQTRNQNIYPGTKSLFIVSESPRVPVTPSLT